MSAIMEWYETVGLIPWILICAVTGVLIGLAIGRLIMIVKLRYK